VFEKFQPEALHDRLWPSLLVIAAIGMFGLVLLFALG
jgi:hypothetical protein